MRTIEEIRLDNYARLIAELGEVVNHKPTGKEIATHFGLTGAYVSQLKTGVRSHIDNAAARKIEKSFGKPRGWMDTDFECWPFPGIEQSRFAALTDTQRHEIQGIVRAALQEFEAKRSKLKAA